MLPMFPDLKMIYFAHADHRHLRRDFQSTAPAGASEFELSTVELTRSGPQYALDTVNILAEQNPGAKLVYLMGGDSLCDLPTWHRPVDFVSACQQIGVMRRPGATIDLCSLDEILPGLASKVRFVEAPLIDISAHEIRRRVAEGRPYQYFVLPEVFAFIASHELYHRR
jgi:nicotinate-nucleotide adenylyltransferase